METKKIKFGAYCDGDCGMLSYVPRPTDPIFIDDEESDNLYWHNIDGPACIWFAQVKPNLVLKNITWYEFNKQHRYDGPAHVVYHGTAVGGKISWKPHTTMWYIRGSFVAEETYTDWLKENGIDINKLADNDKTVIDLKWSTNE